LSKWLRDELARNLRPVRAPESLWDRIERATEVPTAPALHWTRWAIAATLAFTTIVGTYWLPGPNLRADVRTTPATLLKPDLPAEWDLRCAPPSGRSAYQVTNLAARRGHPFALLASAPKTDEAGCQVCHSTSLTQHHL
jgi:hypothetical protein